MQKRFAPLVILFSLLLLAACGSPTAATPTGTATPPRNPTSIYYNAPASSGQPAINALDGATGKLRWSYTTNADLADASPVLADGVIYLAGKTSLIALNASDGKLLWNTSVPDNTGIVAEGNGIVFAQFFTTANDGGLKTSLVALNASTGKTLWNYQFQNGEGNLLADGVLYGSDTLTPFGTPTSPNGSFLLALNGSDGSLKWKTTQESGYLTPISAVQGLLYADNSFPMGGPETIEAYNISDGSLAWKYPSDTGHAAYLGLQNNTLYVWNNGGNTGPLVVALNASTGATIWQSEVDPSLQVFADLTPQAVYLGDGGDNSLTALNAVDGKQLWKTPLGASSGSASAVVTAAAAVDGTVYLSYPGGFAALNASTGAIKWKAQDALTQDPGGHPILAVKGGIIYSKSDTSIAARSAQSGAVLWSQNVAGLVGDPVVG